MEKNNINVIKMAKALTIGTIEKIKKIMIMVNEYN